MTLPQGSKQEGEPKRLAVYSETLSLVMGTESFQALFRQNSRLQDGFWELEFLQNRDHDLVLNGHLQRVGQVPNTALKIGIGIGAYAVAFDESEHEVFALTLSGGVSYDFGTALPTALSLEASAAPEVTTFKDGEQLVDAVLKYEVQVTPNAIAILGGRLVDAETPLSEEVSHEVFVGVRLGF